MSKAIAIAQREVQERFPVVLVACGLATAPFLALLAPSTNVSARLEAVKIIGIVLGVAFVLGLAILLGTSLVGREAREKRLSFYFARPVSPSTIWYGKLLAGVFLLVVTAGIVFLPPALIGGRADRGLWSISTPALIGIALAIAFTIMLAVHAAATMLRSRSPLIVADFIAAVLFVAAVATLAMPILFHFAVKLLTILLSALAAAVIVTLLLAGGWQLANGRTEVRRSHRSLSAFLWGALGCLLVLFAAVTIWVRSAGPEDLKTKRGTQLADSSTVLIGGWTKHRFDYAAAFVANVDTGKVMPVSPFSEWAVALNAKQGLAMWFEPTTAALFSEISSVGRVQREEGSFRLMQSRDGSGAVDTGITINKVPQSIALSEDGSRVAILTRDTLSIFDLRSLKSLGSARVAGDIWNARARFFTPDDVRVYTGSFGDDGRINIWSYSIATRRLTPVLNVPLASKWFHAVPSADGTKLLVRVSRAVGVGPNATRISLHVFDMASGREAFAVENASQGWLFSDGRLATLSVRNGQAVVKLYDAAGNLGRELPVGAAASARFVGEVGRDAIAVATGPSMKSTGGGWKLSRLDLVTGAITSIAKDVAPIGRFPFAIDTSRAVPTLKHPMTDANGDIVAVDLSTGARKKLL